MRGGPLREVVQVRLIPAGTAVKKVTGTVPLAVALTLMVKVVPATTDTMTAPPGIPVPVTKNPTSPDTALVSSTTGLLAVVTHPESVLANTPSEPSPRIVKPLKVLASEPSMSSTAVVNPVPWACIWAPAPTIRNPRTDWTSRSLATF